MSTAANPSPPLPATDSSAERVLERLEWTVIRRLDGLLQGDYRTLFYGAGIDFTDLREYQPQDDVRHIDWNVTARTTTPFVRQYVEDREITAWLLIDLTRSMGFGRLENPKERLLVDFVATIARLLTRSGNRVGALIYDGSPTSSGRSGVVIPPHSGKNQVLRLIYEMQRPRTADDTPPTRLNVLLEQALNTLKRRSLVFVLSDFISEGDWTRPLALLNRRHECVAIRFWDPLEFELPALGMIAVEDLESGRQLLVNTSDPAFRQRFETVVQARETALTAALQQAQVDLFGLSTHDTVVEALLRMSNLRRKKRAAMR